MIIIKPLSFISSSVQLNHSHIRILNNNHLQNKVFFGIKRVKNDLRDQIVADIWAHYTGSTCSSFLEYADRCQRWQQHWDWLADHGIWTRLHYACHHWYPCRSPHSRYKAFVAVCDADPMKACIPLNPEKCCISKKSEWCLSLFTLFFQKCQHGKGPLRLWKGTYFRWIEPEINYSLYCGHRCRIFVGCVGIRSFLGSSFGPR